MPKVKIVNHPQPLRIFAFSDWRIQPLELADSMLKSINDVDLIVYAGDDVIRCVIETDFL